MQGVDRLDSPLGLAAVALAHRVDTSVRETGSGLAAVVRQLEATLVAAAADVRSQDTALDRARDELLARRGARGA